MRLQLFNHMGKGIKLVPRTHICAAIILKKAADLNELLIPLLGLKLDFVLSQLDSLSTNAACLVN